jgi:hypothetical protein
MYILYPSNFICDFGQCKKAQKRAVCRPIFVWYFMNFQWFSRILSRSPSTCKLAKDLILFVVNNIQTVRNWKL